MRASSRATPASTHVRTAWSIVSTLPASVPSANRATVPSWCRRCPPRCVVVCGARPEAATAVHALRDRGWHIEILSGDDPRVVASVGRSLGIAARDCRGGASPEDKRAVVETARLAGPVVMVGDGVNDAAAIAAGLDAFARAGYRHAMIWPEPMTIGSVERVAEAVRLLRGR